MSRNRHLPSRRTLTNGMIRQHSGSKNREPKLPLRRVPTKMKSRSLFLCFALLQSSRSFLFPPATIVPSLSLPRENQICLSATDDDDDEIPTGPASSGVNVIGTELSPCCANVRGTGIGTGFYRNGFCSTGEQDTGRHTVCVQVTDEFLEFSQSVGNDLSTPVPAYMFPGLKEGDVWCLCAQRWAQALMANKAPRVFLRSTHEKTLTFVDFDHLRLYAIDGEEADKALQNLNEQRSKLNDLL